VVMSERRVDEVEAVRRIRMMTRLGSYDGSSGIWRTRLPLTELDHYHDQMIEGDRGPRTTSNP
jgi:hypothetical protein